MMEPLTLVTDTDSPDQCSSGLNAVHGSLDVATKVMTGFAQHRCQDNENIDMLFCGLCGMPCARSAMWVRPETRTAPVSAPLARTVTPVLPQTHSRAVQQTRAFSDHVSKAKRQLHHELLDKDRTQPGVLQICRSLSNTQQLQPVHHAS